MALAASLLGLFLTTWGSLAPPTQDVARNCALSERDAAWLQEALDGWETVARDFLGLDPEPLPWTVLIGTDCYWNLLPEGEIAAGYVGMETSLTFAGRPISLLARPHEGMVRLPSGAEVPARGMAFASLFNEGRTPFFVLALPDVFRLDPDAPQLPGLEKIILAVASHEIVHTRQLAAIHRRIAALEGQLEIPENVDDDIIQNRFGDDREFRGAIDVERELLYYAVTAEGDDKLRSLVGALAVLRERREKFFVGPNAPYAQIEDLFLNMEGVAEWSKMKLELTDPKGRSLEELLDEASDPGNSWSQSIGLALFLLLDDLVPGWQERVFPPELASPVALLEEVLGGYR